jgi:hypothetical protein
MASILQKSQDKKLSDFKKQGENILNQAVEHYMEEASQYKSKTYEKIMSELKSHILN